MDGNLRYIENEELFDTVVLDGILKARRSVLIATANLKDLHVPSRGKYRSIAYEYAVLCEGGVEVNILHGGVPSEPFLHSFKDSGLSNEKLFTARRCPRVHFKAVIMDANTLYLGSANMTGAGLGAKSETRRNFETGVLTTDTEMIERVTSLFQEIWEGRKCNSCGRHNVCYCPLEEMQ